MPPTATPAAPATPAPAAPDAGKTPAPQPGNATPKTPPAATPPKPDAAAKPAEGADALKSAADNAVKKYKLQIDGKEEEVDEKELILRAQKATGSEKKFEEAARTRRMMETLISRLKDPANLWEVLKHPMIGHDPYTLAENLLLARMEEEKMTPAEKQVRQAQEILKREEQRKKQEEQVKSQQRMAELQKQAGAKLTEAIKATLETAGLPKSSWTVRMMAYFMHKGWTQYQVRLQPADVVPMVKKQYQAMIGDFLGAYEGDIFEVLGDPLVEKIRTGLAGRPRNPETPVSAKDQPPPSNRPPQERKTVSMDEWRERNERIKQGLE